MTLTVQEQAARRRARLTELVAAGLYAETIRDIPRTCLCPWDGPRVNDPAHYIRIGWTPACPIAMHHTGPPKAAAA